ncbi:MAG: hypothetical protein AAF958_16640 [Planctomycetota bacterium]
MSGQPTSIAGALAEKGVERRQQRDHQFENRIAAEIDPAAVQLWRDCRSMVIRCIALAESFQIEGGQFRLTGTRAESLERELAKFNQVPPNGFDSLAVHVLRRLLAGEGSR